jgi:solute:Na+ symporter, SSS family
VCGVNMFAMAKVMQLILGWNIHFSIWVSSITVAVYVALGGLLSAVFNEVLQFFLIWLGTLLIPVLGIIEAGGWSKMLATINAAHPGQNFTHLWANMGSPADNPMGVHWTGMVLGLGIAVSFGYWCTDFLQVQRVMAAKSLRTAQNGTVLGAALKMCVPIIVTVPGLLGLAVLTQKAGITLVPESVAQSTGGHSYNEVLPLMMSRYLGPGLLGLGITAMIAGFMSGMAGNVSAFATVWTYDVYRPLIRKNAGDAHYVRMGRWCSVIGVFVAIGTAYTAMLFSNILVYLQVLVGFFIVPLFGVVILGMLWRRATPAAGFWGFLSGILSSIGQWVYIHTGHGGFDPVNLNPEHVRRVAFTPLAGDFAVNLYSSFWSLMITLIMTAVVSAFTRPKPVAELKDLVIGLTRLPDEGPCPWYRKPAVWAAVVAAALIAVNVYFW